MVEYLKIKYMPEITIKINKRNKKPIKTLIFINISKTIRIKYSSYRNNNFNKIIP